MTTATVPPAVLPATSRRTADLPGLVARTQALLDGRVPLSLLLDLADPQGPRSAALYQDEAADCSWLRSVQG
jgi:hypothetical protein